MSLLSSEPLRITPLGAGCEVGRSCIVLSYKGKTVMLDCGTHPAYSGLNSLPFFDEIDPATVDLVLISHFHLDHAASLPYFTERTNFKGKVFMTHPTKSIFRWILSDFVRVAGSAGRAEEAAFREGDLVRCFDRIVPIDFHQQIECSGVKVTALNAGHVLGAAMFLIEIAGVRILYTGDYSREEDRHLMSAELPSADIQIDVLICESTYGVQCHMPRAEREKRFTSLVHGIVARGGRCLLPVFALGRAQELMLILDEYWEEKRDELSAVPIYFASSLAKKCITIYQTFINMMNDRIKRQHAQSNPFLFKHITTLRSIEQFDDVGPCVMLASPGMLQSGLSRELLELWCPSRKNGVIIAGYCVEGTLAKELLNDPEEIVASSGAKIPMRMSVDYVSFSAHVDFLQNAQFIETVNAGSVVFVHGEQHEMFRLRSAMVHKFEQLGRNTAVHCPRNCETVEMEFRGEKVVRVIGAAARQGNANVPEASFSIASQSTAAGISIGATVEGVLVGKDFEYEIVDAKELAEFANVPLTSLTQQLHFTCSAPFSLLEYHISHLFGIANVSRIQSNKLLIMNTVVLEDCAKSNTYVITWQGNAISDMVADAVAAIAVHAEISRSSIKLTKHSHSHSHSHSHESASTVDLDVALQYLHEHFENVSVDEDAGRIVIEVGNDKAFVNIEQMVSWFIH